MIDQPHDDRRRHVRTTVHLPGTAYVLCDTQVKAIKVWTRNLSPEGVCLMSHVELEGTRMLLDLPHPDFQGRLIECEVRHRSSFDRELVSGGFERMHVCGLDFRRVIAKDDVHDTLRRAFQRQSSDEWANPTSDSREDSLMPLLSAFGILVVYLSRLPWV